MEKSLTDQLRPDFEYIAANMHADTLLRAMKNGLNGVARRLRDRKRRDIAASQPAEFRPAIMHADTVRAKVYRDLRGIRVRISHNWKKYPGAFVDTGRPSQPREPLVYWYEQGLTADRPTRGKDRRKRQARSPWAAPQKNYGSITAWSGAHALAYTGDIDTFVDEQMAVLLEKSINKTFDKYGL